MISDGLRINFFQIIFDDDDIDPFIEIFRSFIYYLAAGRAPEAIRPWLGGGTLIGVDKWDTQGRPMDYVAYLQDYFSDG